MRCIVSQNHPMIANTKQSKTYLPMRTHHTKPYMQTSRTDHDHVARSFLLLHSFLLQRGCISATRSRQWTQQSIQIRIRYRIAIARSCCCCNISKDVIGIEAFFRFQTLRSTVADVTSWNGTVRSERGGGGDCGGDVNHRWIGNWRQGPGNKVNSTIVFSLLGGKSEYYAQIVS